MDTTHFLKNDRQEPEQPSSVFSKLKKLFSTDVIVRNVGGTKIKIVDTDHIQTATDRNSLRDRFNRLRSTTNLYQRDMIMSYQSARLELFRDYDCVGPDTIIPLPDGSYPTIKELTEKYKNDPQKRFYVFSYDHKTDSIKLGNAYHPRKKGKRVGYKVTFDNGKYIIGSDGHPFLMRNGEYKIIKDLTVGESVMPFYQNECGYKNNNFKIISIECIGDIDVYDVTVEEFQNFATDSCFVHNTMDMDAILSSALDIYADEATTRSELGWIITINSKNNNIKKILHNLFYDILNIEFNLWSWTRNMCKYGDFFLKLDISPEYGIYGVQPVSAYEITRIEHSDPDNPNYVKFKHDGVSGGGEYENFEMAHFRLLSDSNFLPYGKSMLENARRIWKQMSLMEDALLIHRIMRAPEKRIFKIDIGNIPPSEVDGFMERVISKHKRAPFIDDKTGDYNLRFNLQNITEDFYLPVRGGDSGTSIDTLGGLEWTGTEDIEYLKNKLLAALKIPKAFLGYDETVSGKGTLAMEDIRFARTVLRIQNILISELTKIAIIHLYVQGFTDSTLVDFELSLTNPSTIFEQEKIALWNDKVSVSREMIDNKLFSRKWIYQNIFNITESEQKGLIEDIVQDSKQTYRFNQIENDGSDPAKSVGGGGGFGSMSRDEGDDIGTDDDSENIGGEGNEAGEETSETGGESTPSETTGTEEEPISEVHHGNSNPEEEKLQREKDAEKKRKRLKARGGVEDVLGKKEIKQKINPKSNAVNPSLRKSYYESLTSKLSKKYGKTVINESNNSSSLLDEKNILDEM
jgi:hypothetical protein